MILGIAILWATAGTMTMTEIHVKPEGLAAASFVLMMIGAIGKAGAMPFHTWIPDAAIDAPVSVMAFIPASLEKLLGIYFLARITLDFFPLEKNSTLAIVLMAIGALTIVLAVFMALIQKDFKRLLSYHAVSQVGYMILGIGTAVPIGIAGGIFHMINHAMYKAGLFLSSGSVEHRAGTTELKKLGGLRREMPLTAARVHRLRPGHFRGLAAQRVRLQGNGLPRRRRNGLPCLRHRRLAGRHPDLLLVPQGRALGLPRAAKPRRSARVKESEGPVFLPILILAFLCILFGVYNKLPLKAFIEPILEGHTEAGAHLDFTSHALALLNPIALISVGCLVVGAPPSLHRLAKDGPARLSVLGDRPQGSRVQADL